MIRFFASPPSSLPAPGHDEQIDLPSPSCCNTEATNRWDLESYHFDVKTLIDTSIALSQLFDLGDDNGHVQIDGIISQAAHETHRRKIGARRTKLEMEAR
ncbi:unnamed protein product [Linum trigynum]|uniref:Uncharacterized protein n=1 Tax=Linum trigynum TaxID=586398 RepID=A0AAV2FRL3_9ROSI